MPELNELIQEQGEAISYIKHKVSENESKLKELDSLDVEAIKKAIDDAAQIEELKQSLDRLRTADSQIKREKEEIELKNVREYSDAMGKYLRKGTDFDTSKMELKELSVGIDPDGGYLVTPEMSNRVVKRIFETTPMRSLAAIQNISTDALELIIDDNTGISGGWTSEKGTVSETNTPQIGSLRIPTHEQFAEPHATQKLLDDAAINVEQWLADKTADILTRTENTSFITGTGAGQPMGINTYAEWSTPSSSGVSGTYERNALDTISSGSAGAITIDTLIVTKFSLLEEYQANAKWLMSRATAGSLFQQKDGQSRYHLLPDLSKSGDMTMLGKPIVFASDMPAIATDSISIAYGDFARGYQIVDRLGIRVLRDPFTAKPFVKFYTTKRVGGAVVNFDAIKRYKLSA